LITEADIWWSYLDNKKLDYRAICRKFGVRPEQIADQLALTGDKVDNIPGIPEVGLKTAARLLKKYDSVDNLRRHLHQVGEMKFRYAARVQRSLIEHESQLDVSLQLTRINREISEMRQVDISRHEANAKQLECMMREQALGPERSARWLAYLQTPLAGAG
jgi:5'-3' exonuclease